MTDLMTSGPLYTPDHQWIRVDGAIATIGITVHAQHQLIDVVSLDLPDPGRRVEAGKDAAVVEATKAAVEVHAPVTGEVTAINGALGDEPALVNADPEGEGWLYQVRLADPAELRPLMDRAGYDAFVAGLD